MLIFVDLFQTFSGQRGFHNKIFLGNMALLIRSYHGKTNTMARSVQDLSQDCPKILLSSCQDRTKISMEGQPG